jgi:hypothetical protein
MFQIYMDSAKQLLLITDASSTEFEDGMANNRRMQPSRWYDLPPDRRFSDNSAAIASRSQTRLASL